MRKQRRRPWAGRAITGILAIRAVLAGLVALALGIGPALAGAIVPLPSAVTQQATAAPPSPKPVPPNVVVIETDDQTAESTRVMTELRTRLGGQGATFSNSFVNYPLCCPSRATFLTGQYAHNHGVLDNSAPDGGFEVFEASYATNNLAVWLQNAGYRTAMIGKYLNGYGETDPTLVPPGWTEWYAAVPPEQRVYDYDLNENGILVHYGTAPTDFKQDMITAKAVDFINRRAPSRRPFFAWVTYTAPHEAGPNPNPNPPFDCDNTAKPAPRHAAAFDAEALPQPPSFNEADVSDKPPSIQGLPQFGPFAAANVERRYRCRLESLLSVDEGIGQIVGALRSAGELRGSLVIFTSDNGFFHGEHRIKQGKFDLYEESIQVPLLMRGLGIPDGVRVDALAMNADLAPTILSAASVSPNLVVDGESLLPFAKQPGTEPPRDLLIESNTYAAIRTNRCLLTGPCIYAEHFAGENMGAQELYDLGSDPYELDSLHASPDPTVQQARAELAQRLQALRECAGPTCR